MIATEEKRTSRDAERMREKRASAKDVIVPDLSDDDRDWRLALEQSDSDWLRFFFPDPPYGFWYEFTAQQQAMIDAIGHAIKHGGDQSLAASRGEGKTQLARRLTLKYILSGSVRFVVLFAATAADAGDSLTAMRGDLEESDLLLRYYPEVCAPVRALENTPNRAHYQTVSGTRFDNGEVYERTPSKFTWCGHEITLPNVPGSPSAGSIIATRGLDSAVRGLNKKGRRPDVAIIDDPDTEETARSEDQADKLEQRIDRAIAGLGGQQRGIARVMLTTLQSRISASYKFTDPVVKPSWKGRRFRFLLRQPDRPELWDEYVQLRQACLQKRDDEGEPSDPFARGAHAFYLERRAEMDAGAQVANEHRYNPADLGDGSQLEVSALQRYFNEVARVGPVAVATEYDNDPPEETGQQESGITAHRIQCQVSGYDRKIVPPGTVAISQGIDCRKTALHWCVRAWVKADGSDVATGHTIDYGVTEVRGPATGDEGLDEAIVRALRERRNQMADDPYTKADGEIVDVGITLIDSGWQQEAVYQFCREDPLHFRPAIGAGEGGAARTNFNPVVSRTHQKKPGDGWFEQLQEGRSIWLVVIDSKDWKNWEHCRWMSDPLQPGALLMWGEGPTEDDIRRQRLSRDQKTHFSFSKHLTAEVLVEEPNREGVTVRKWKAKSDTNHYFDAAYRADVGASMLGVPLFQRKGAKRIVQQVACVSLADMAKGG